MDIYDQAQNLRNAIIEKKAESAGLLGPRVICISSGKGGVGKSNITINLAIALSNQGKKVIVIDADLGLANIEILLGIIPKHSLLDLVKLDLKIDQILSDGPNNIQIISGGSGIMELSNMSRYKLSVIIDNISLLRDKADYILIDTGAGISDIVTTFANASGELIAITTCEPTSIADAYALIKVISSTGEDKKINVIVNRAESAIEADNVFQKINAVSNKFLKKNLNYLGYVSEDSNISRAVKQQKAFINLYPATIASKCLINISSNIINQTSGVESVEQTGFNKFLTRLKGIFSK